MQANDLLGHTGLIRHSVETTGSNYTGVPIDGIATEIIDNDAPAIVVQTVGGSLTVSEGGIATATLRVRPTLGPDGTVVITLVAPAVDPTSTSRARVVELSVDGITWGLSLIHI